jgi:hypothetical protein
MLSQSGTCLRASAKIGSRPIGFAPAGGSGTLTAGVAAGPWAAGGSLPVSLKTRSEAHLYEMTMPVVVRTMSTGRHQKPITLCQLKSRALPCNPRLNQRVGRIERSVHLRGHHRYRPEMARNRKAVLQTPVMALPTARLSPCAPSHRCHSSRVWKKPRRPRAPWSRTSPV